MRDRIVWCVLVAGVVLGAAPAALAQTPSCPGGVCTVSTEAQLRDALTPGGAVDAAAGDTILFNANITLTSDMTAVQQNITIRNTVAGWVFTLEYETTQASNESHNALRFRVRAQ
ncbi:MAG TPA: hypothetical protein VEU08_17090 [Vicinamibacterales bacterium]|nr:hypothetical protein [Vicinamibacterales bacterium]